MIGNNNKPEAKNTHLQLVLATCSKQSSRRQPGILACSSSSALNFCGWFVFSRFLDTLSVESKTERERSTELHRQNRILFKIKRHTGNIHSAFLPISLFSLLLQQSMIFTRKKGKSVRSPPPTSHPNITPHNTPNVPERVVVIFS